MITKPQIVYLQENNQHKNMAHKRWAFFSYGHNLGDFTRAAETARAMMRTGSTVEFFNHGSVHLGDAARHSLRSFNDARKHFGLSPITNIVDLVRGDLTLLPDLPELSGLPAEKLSPGYRYSAPIFAMPNIPVQDEVRRVFSRPGINVFCSMGSSGYPESLRMVVAALRSRPEVNLVVACTTIVPASELGPAADNFFASSFLPAHSVNEMADAAFLHGGQGTIQTAVWAGTPVVGIGFQAEQQTNINGIARTGMARRIPIFELSAQRVLRELDEIQKPAYRTNALRLKELVRATDGAMLSAQLMNDFIG